MQARRYLCASLGLVLLLGLILPGCSSTRNGNPWIATSEQDVLTEKVKTSRNAYLRYTQAEEDARRDGVPEAIEQYGRAKAAAKKELEQAERELSAYEAGKGIKSPKTAP